jgi:hypothetical protein
METGMRVIQYSLFTGSGPQRLSSVPEDKGNDERKAF